MIHKSHALLFKEKHMGKRFDTMLFPGGKKKAFTLSYDDGVIQDRRLTEICKKYGVKATFNLNAGVLGYQQVVQPRMGGGKSVDISKVNPEEVKDLYDGLEVGGHGLYHSSLVDVKAPLASYEIVEDKCQLEKLVGYPMKMFAYPFGIFNDEVKQLLRNAGYRGARTIVSTHTFDIPKDLMEWNPTCHHKDEKLMELAQQFCERPAFRTELFYVWGHGYEFDGDDNWDVIEDLVKYVSQYKDDIWFATNSEIIDYIEAYNRLEYSVDGSLIRNPSAIDVWIGTDFMQKEQLKKGEVTAVKDTAL